MTFNEFKKLPEEDQEYIYNNLVYGQDRCENCKQVRELCEDTLYYQEEWEKISDKLEICEKALQAVKCAVDGIEV